MSKWTILAAAGFPAGSLLPERGTGDMANYAT